ncbi:MAG TPA: hypothetical protein VNR87_03740, partial [Flavisolibacter sp.]|nr:hypothetical protein [Flavisolibacter sp.]
MKPAPSTGRHPFHALLSSPWASALVLITAIGARCLMQVYFFDYTGDRSYQLVAAHNFMEGHGLSIGQVFASDLQQTVFKPLIGWPPGYSVFLSVFLFITNNNFYLASLLLDLVCAALFVIYARKILQLCNLPAWMLNLYTLLTGFFIFDFAYASTTDFNTLAFFVIAIFYTLAFIQNNRTPSFGIIIGLLLFLTPRFRYMYVALVIGIPAYLIVYGNGTNNRRVVRGGMYCGATLAVLLSALFIFQHYSTGASTYIIPSQKGFYPENIFRTYPVLLTPFVDFMFFCVSISKYFHADFVRLVDLIRLLHLAPFVLVFGWSLIYLWRKRFAARTASMHYLVLGLVCSLLNVLLLLYLSVRNAPILSITYPVWTFLEEARYYAFPVLFIQQMAFLIFFRSFGLLAGWKRRVAWVMAILLAIQLL